MQPCHGAGWSAPNGAGMTLTQITSDSSLHLRSTQSLGIALAGEQDPAFCKATTKVRQTFCSLGQRGDQLAQSGVRQTDRSGSSVTDINQPRDT